jgi:hypothetical protein
MTARIFLCTFFFLFVYSNNADAGFSVKPDSGAILVWRHGTSSWAAVKDSFPVSAGDSLYLDDKCRARLFLGAGSTVLFRGELRANLSGSDTALAVRLDAGQLFLKHDPGAVLANITVVLRGCSFVPVGTAAAFKFTRQGEASVAVLSGKIRVEPPKGETALVPAGSYGTYDPALGAFKEGMLSAEAISALENWSGAKFEAASAASSAADTGKPAMKDTTHASAPAAAFSPAPAAEKPVTAAPEKQAETPPASPVKNEEKPEQPAAAPAGQPASATAEKQEQPAQEGRREKKEQAKPAAGATPGVTWELSAGTVTVGDEQWTRLAISPDIPIWKFGIGLDVELFLDAKGDFSDKGWKFDHDNWAGSVLRKIKYLRFGYENDPVFVKVGGLSNVTLGYGFVVDRFTNMLHYPDQKLLGLQFYLTNVSPVGVTLQTMVSDFMEFKYNAGLAAARLAVCPIKTANIPVLSNLSIGATYAVDVNEYAPARGWAAEGDPRDRNDNGVFDVAYWRGKYPSAIVDSLIAHGDADTSRFTIDTTYRDSASRYALLGADIGLPIIKSDFLGLDLYGQAAVVADTSAFKQNRRGWGLGAPGVALRVGPVSASVEYRHVVGRFVPGYFGPYYLDERLQRYPFVETKSQGIDSTRLDGVFGRLGFNIVDVVLVDGTYQYLTGKNRAKDQRIELSGGLGDALLKRIPKITKAEIYLDKKEIGSTVMSPDTASAIRYDAFFDLTPSFYWGYRVGVAITQGASLVFDACFGYRWDIDHRLVPNNNMTIRTAITF